MGKSRGRSMGLSLPRRWVGDDRALAELEEAMHDAILPELREQSDAPVHRAAGGTKVSYGSRRRSG